ncbi:uncharacterized protein LOC120124231 [Hibiscus syriacus]|uniref:uncharacterized protein LOC120124231 n=1 Tax=Hibiscus syriacus TaxID=106335 RepID=UPI0019241A59|nr:uncharacterized protein LOC120124231 [Hibiscus syriacus]
MEFRNSSYGNESYFSSPQQHGNMEFKDATAAAHAAAESAERASMAAQAAAEHLENISQQYSMDSNMSARGMKDEELRKKFVSTSQYEHLSRRTVNNSIHGTNSTNYEQTDSNEPANQTGEIENGLSNMVWNDDKFTRGASKSTAATFNEKSLVTNQIPDTYSQRNSSVGRQTEHFGEVIMKRDSGNEMHFVNELHSKNAQNVDHHEVKDREQTRYSSSHSQSNTFRDDCDGASNLSWQKTENDKRNSDERKQFVNELHDRRTSDFADYQEGRTGKQSSSSSSSSDKFDLEEEHKEHEYGMNFLSPFQRPPTHPCPCTHSWSTEKKVESPKESTSQSHILLEKQFTPIVFESSTNSAGPSHVDDLPPTFDNYGPSSESEGELDKFDRNNNYIIGSQKKNLESHEAENIIFNQPLSGDMEDGIRNKDYRYPPYALSSSEAENDTPAGFKQSPPPLEEDSVSSRSYNREPKGSDESSIKLSKRASVTRADSSDDFEKERPKHSFSSTRDQYNRMPSFEEDRRSTLTVPAVPYFDLENSDSNENLPKTSPNARSRTQFPHQKNVSPSNSPGNSTLETTLSSEPTEKEHPCTSVPEIVSPGSYKSSEAQTSIGEKSTHVHPKLPDYDTLTAFLNLSNRIANEYVCSFCFLIQCSNIHY